VVAVAVQVVDAAHIRVMCDACRTATAEVCDKRNLPVVARVAAIRKFTEVHTRAAGRINDATRP
jgi:hypothetical protein